MPADRLITVMIEAEGSRPQYGEYVLGSFTSIRTWASRRDLVREDLDLPEGVRPNTRRTWRIRWDSRIVATPTVHLWVVDEENLLFDVENVVEVTEQPGRMANLRHRWQDVTGVYTVGGDAREEVLAILAQGRQQA